MLEIEKQWQRKQPFSAFFMEKVRSAHQISSRLEYILRNKYYLYNRSLFDSHNDIRKENIYATTCKLRFLLWGVVFCFVFFCFSLLRGFGCPVFVIFLRFWFEIYIAPQLLEESPHRGEGFVQLGASAGAGIQLPRLQYLNTKWSGNGAQWFLRSGSNRIL